LRRSCYIEVIETLAVVIAFLEYGNPAKTGLLSFQTEKFEQQAIVPYRDPPFLVMIGNIDRVVPWPPAA
jgi:hypothetical protein